MHKRKVIAIRNDIVEQWFVPRGHAPMTSYCRLCDRASVWLSVPEAATSIGDAAGAIRDLAEGGELHSLFTQEGHLVICTNSIGQYVSGK